MNLVGKILTVFILVMSLVFMSFAVAVYATHKNWREVVMRPREEAVAPGKPVGLMFQLEDQRKRFEDLQAQKDALEARLTAEKNAQVQALTKLNAEFVAMEKELDQLQQERDGIDQERRDALSGLENAEKRLAALRREVEGDQDNLGLRKRIAQAQKEREQYFNEMVRLADEKYNAINELKRLRDHQQVLRLDLDNALAVLRKHGLKPVPELYAGHPPDVESKVLATTSKGLVEIKIGSDDGLLKGHKLEVYRPSGYVGRIEVLKTEVDKAVCQVVPGYLKSRIQKDDLVTSRLFR